MKKLVSLTVLLLICFAVKAQPSTFAKVNDQYYINKYEVSNGDYKKFLNDLAQTKQAELYKKCLPDTMLWGKENRNQPYVTYYFSYPTYANYPVVGITYEDAVEYCKWLTGVYNSKTDRGFKKVVFRLPTDEEWTLAANGGDKDKVYTWNSPYVLDAKKGYMCNFLRVGDNMISYDASQNSFKVVNTSFKNFSPQDKAIIPAPVESFFPNRSGIYNMCGNVAEMVSEQGIAKGGSYNDPGYDVRIASVKRYSQPSVEIGFRVAMEVLEK